MEKADVTQLIREAQELHSLGGFSANSTANGWQVLVVQELRQISQKLTELISMQLLILNEVSVKADAPASGESGGTTAFKRTRKMR